MAETATVPIDRRLVREEAFARLVSGELAGAYRTAAVLLGDAAEAEDATQDALVRAWQRWDRLREEDRAGAWFGRILVNVCRDRLRSRRTVAVRWVPVPASPDAPGDAGEREALWEAVADLSADHRIVIVLRYYLDLPLEVIAERTGAPIGTVKSRLHHALRAVRAVYEAQGRASEGEATP
jgi:RNA polymerase sigma-70 factor, ECF subfamily